LYLFEVAFIIFQRVKDILALLKFSFFFALNMLELVRLVVDKLEFQPLQLTQKQLELLKVYFASAA